MQEGHTLGQWVHGRLFIQFQAQPGQVFLNNSQAFPQVFFIRVNQYKIIHIPDILPNMQLFLD